MPNENVRVCGCGLVVDLPKSRNSTISTRKLTILNSRKSGKTNTKASKEHQQDDRGPKCRTSESGNCSSVNDYARVTSKSNKHKKRLSHSRRTRSAERSESHYTYIDSGSSIVSGGLREDIIPEAIYATIPDIPDGSGVNDTSSYQTSTQNQLQPIYAIPSMTSPPPTYDVAIAKTWQTGLPPTYEEYLCHKYAMLSRSHTPPPPWSDTTTPMAHGHQPRRDPLTSQQELREYLAQLSLSQGNEQSGLHNQQHHQQHHQRDINYLSNQQLRREQQIRAQQRARNMPPRSQSESRVQQQRIATMYEDGAFCMETTALQSAFENGVAFCTLM